MCSQGTAAIASDGNVQNRFNEIGLECIRHLKMIIMKMFIKMNFVI